MYQNLLTTLARDPCRDELEPAIHAGERGGGAACALDETLLRQAEREYDFDEKIPRGAPAAAGQGGAGPPRAPTTPKRRRPPQQSSAQPAQKGRGKGRADAGAKASSWSGWGSKSNAGGNGGKWQKRY